MITLEDVKNNEEVQAFVNASQKQLKALGYTEHSNRHIGIVSKRTEEILTKLGYDEHTIELGKIAGYFLRRQRIERSSDVDRRHRRHQHSGNARQSTKVKPTAWRKIGAGCG